MADKYAVLGKDILNRDVFYSKETNSSNTYCASLSDKMSVAVEWFDECIANTAIGINNPEVVRLQYITEDVDEFKAAKLRVETMMEALSNTELAILSGQL